MRGVTLLAGAGLAGWLAASPQPALSEAMPEPVDAGRADPVWIAPVLGARSSPFGYRVHPVTGRRKLHRGVDFAADRGTPVRAARSGVVRRAGWSRGYGRIVVIDHGEGLTTRYAHLSRIAIREGQRVEAGQLIGRVGSSGRATGPHLHFEVRRGGRPINPWPLVADRARSR